MKEEKIKVLALLPMELPEEIELDNTLEAMNIYGYCRISTAKQSIDRQIRNIKAEYPTAHIVQEAYTGTSIFRPEWLKLYRILKSGDTVVFDSVSRMSRNAEEGFALYEDLYHKGIQLVFLKEHHFKHEDFHRTESGAYLIGGCKTEAGRNRIIPILDFGIPVFEHAYATSVENGPLFPNGKGGFWNEKNWRNRKFYPFLEEIGIQPNPYDENGKRKPEFAGKLATYTPYTTRHTYASLCDRAGVNKDILKRAVGHTPKSKTLDEVYLHPKATQMIEAFDKANQLVNDEVLTTTKA